MLYSADQKPTNCLTKTSSDGHEFFVTMTFDLSTIKVIPDASYSITVTSELFMMSRVHV